MGLFTKFRNKAAKGAKDEKIRQAQRESEAQKGEVKKDLTLAELKEKKESAPVASDRKVVKKAVKEDTRMAYRYLIKPMVTEKGAYLVSDSKYLFQVDRRANKVEIKKAIQAVYGVSPVKVNIVNLPGKSIRYGKISGKTKDVKKAIVTLKKGESIEVYEGV